MLDRGVALLYACVDLFQTLENWQEKEENAVLTPDLARDGESNDDGLDDYLEVVETNSKDMNRFDEENEWFIVYWLKDDSLDDREAFYWYDNAMEVVDYKNR